MWRVINGILEKNGQPVASLVPINKTTGEWDIQDLSIWMQGVRDEEDQYSGCAYTDDDLSNATDAAYNEAIDDINKVIDTAFDKADLPQKKSEKLLLEIDKGIEGLRKDQ